MPPTNKIRVLALLAFLVCSSPALSQTTAFTYQGKLVDNTIPANGTYQMQFSLHSAAAGTGNQIGSTVSNDTVTVTNGVLTVQLDFTTPNAFDGGARWLQIAVKRPADASFTILSPRQPLSSAPYAVKSLNSVSADTAINATELGGVAANQYVVTNDARMTDARTPLPGSADYIQNRTTQQALSNFNVSGNGTIGGNLTANLVTSSTQFNIGPNRVLSEFGLDNVFVGTGSGAANAGGGENAFFGNSAGFRNTSGSSNSFFGRQAGGFTMTGSRNTFDGDAAGRTNSSGNENTMIGYNANPEIANLSNATAIGSRAMVSQSNSIVLGGISGVNDGTDTNVGIGTTTPAQRLHVVGNGMFEGNIGLTGSLTASSASLSSLSVSGTINAGSGVFGGVQAQGLTVPQNSSGGVSAPRLTIGGPINVGTISFVPASGGSLSLCLTNLQSQIATCSSSIRYKQNVHVFNPGLSLVNRLRPVTFNWKDGNMPDLGLVAEDVAKIDPLLVTYNEKNGVEGVKYDRIGVILVNAVKEQQLQIERQQNLIEAQQKQIDELKRLVCVKISAKVCRENRQN